MPCLPVARETKFPPTTGRRRRKSGVAKLIAAAEKPATNFPTQHYPPDVCGFPGVFRYVGKPAPYPSQEKSGNNANTGPKTNIIPGIFLAPPVDSSPLDIKTAPIPSAPLLMKGPGGIWEQLLCFVSLVADFKPRHAVHACAVQQHRR